MMLEHVLEHAIQQNVFCCNWDEVDLQRFPKWLPRGCFRFKPRLEDANAIFCSLFDFNDLHVKIRNRNLENVWFRKCGVRFNI